MKPFILLTHYADGTSLMLPTAGIRRAAAVNVVEIETFSGAKASIEYIEGSTYYVRQDVATIHHLITGEAPATAPARTDREIVDQTEELARAFGRADGYVWDYCTPDSNNPRIQRYWSLACIAQEYLTNTDPMNAAANLDN